MGKCDNFFGMVLPSSSLLILDFIHAANTIIDSGNIGVSVTFRVSNLPTFVIMPTGTRGNFVFDQSAHLFTFWC